MNSEWSDGYITDVNYTPGFYREQMPGVFEYCGLMQNMRVPQLANGFTYCELGCGLGVSAIVAATTHPHAKFWALDFNPAHIAYGADLAAAAGLDNIIFHERSFSEAADSNDYPQFDLISLHGIYSWISAEVRADIQRFIRKFLKPGGMVYVSYNCQPGWSRNTPIQHWLAQFADIVPGNSITKVKAGMDFLNRMREGGALYFAANPAVEKHLEGMNQRPPSYLSHEYLNGSWHPLFVTDVIAEMELAKLNYCGSAAFVENIDGYCLNQIAQDQIKTLPNKALQELYRDYASNRNFRRDIYVRGALPLSILDRRNLLNQMRFGLLSAPDQIAYTTRCPIGEVNFDGPQCRAMIAALANGPQSIGVLRRSPGLEGLTDGGILSVLNTLVIGGAIYPVGTSEPPAPTAAQRLNKIIGERLQGGDQILVVVAPNLGGGIPVTVNDILLLAEDWSQDSTAIAERLSLQLRLRGQHLIVQGRTLSDPQELVNQLRIEADQFRTSRLPVFRLAGILV